jgi:hypothetical protein
MTHRRLYSTAVIAGILLAVGLAFWRRAGGGSTREMLVWAAGGFAVAILFAFVAGLGMRLQRRDIPKPGATDPPKEAGRLDDE